MPMLSLLFFLVTSALAKTDGCSLNQILRTDKPDKKCVAAYLAKIPNEEDRAEAKFRLQQWRAMKNLEVFNQDGFIEAFSGEKIFMRALLLKKQKPMLIWMDGKILVDNSDNPSFARRIGNAMKKHKSAALDLILPKAHANDADPQATVLILYGLDTPENWGEATAAVRSTNISQFLPKNSAFTNWLFGNINIECTRENVIGSTEFITDETSDMYPKYKITPQSPTDFLVQGLKKGVTHRLRLPSSENIGGQSLRISRPSPDNDDGLLIETCEDAKCSRIKRTENLKDWNLLLGLDPAENAKQAPRQSPSNTEIISKENRHISHKLSQRLFGLSVMGECCRNEICRAELQKRFNLKLLPTDPTPSPGAR